MATQDVNILLVEDERITALHEKTVLEAAGHTVMLAADGESATEIVRHNPSVAIVLMDIDLGPGMDGTEAARRILEVRELPVVFVTSHTEQAMVERVKNITRYGYVVKDSGAFVLLQSIAMAVELFETQRELEAERRNLELIATHSHDGFAIMSEREVRYLSPSYCRLLGYREGDPVEMDIESATERIHPDDVERVRAIATAARARGDTTARYRYRCRRRGGGYFWAEDQITYLREEGSNDVTSVVVSRDVTNEVAAEKARTEQRKRYESLFYSDLFTVTIFDSEARIVDTNAAWSDPDSPGSWIGKLLGEVIPEMHDEALHRITRSLATDVREEYTDEVTLPGGQTRWYRSAFTRLPEESENDGLVLVVSQDITNERTRSLQLEQRQRFIEAVTGTAPVLMYVFDLNARRNVWINQAYRDFLRTINDADNWQLDLVDLTNYIHPEDRARLISREKLRSEGVEPDTDLELRVGREGSWRWMLNRSTRLPGEDSIADGRIVGFLVDITELKHANESLREARRSLQILMKEMNHRIKNNLHLARSLVHLKSVDSGVDLSDLEAQVAAIGLIHESLLENTEDISVELKSYLGRIAESVTESAGYGRDVVEIKIPQIRMSAKQAVPLGLIVNEATTNAVKHGFRDGDRNRMAISVQERDHHWEMDLQNSGRPFPAHVDFSHAETLGLTLIRMLTEQIGGSVRFSPEPETRITVEIPGDKLEKEA